jgi:hypothetical protein
MEIIAYTEQPRTYTIKFALKEMIDLHSVAIGVLNTDQDYTILGITEERMREIEEDFERILKMHGPK